MRQGEYTMKIKDVEQRTGLTAKSIRHYEAKGLLQVGREEHNAYRSYTEENVQELKRIRLLRYLDFSIEQIREIQQLDAAQVKEILIDKAETLDNQSQDLEMKRNLCRTLSKDGISNDAVVGEYMKIFEALGGEGDDDLAECLKDLSCPSMTELIGWTLLCSGPIFWLFINIQDQKWNLLMVNAILALLGTVGITGNWINYLHKKKFQPKRVKKNNRADWYILPAALIGCVLGIVMIIFVMAEVEIWLAPQGWLFYQLRPWAEFFLILFLVLPAFYFAKQLLFWLSGKIRKSSNINAASAGQGIFRKYWVLFTLVWGMAVYVCLTSATFILEDQIIVRTPFRPQGRCYSYEEVTKVQTGFGRKAFSLHEYEKKGNFFYKITLDGRQIVLHQPSVNEQIARYEEDTYLELEEFDQRLMKLGIKKESDEIGYQDCELDQQFVDRFRRIIANGKGVE